MSVLDKASSEPFINININRTYRCPTCGHRPVQYRHIPPVLFPSLVGCCRQTCLCRCLDCRRLRARGKAESAYLNSAFGWPASQFVDADWTGSRLVSERPRSVRDYEEKCNRCNREVQAKARPPWPAIYGRQDEAAGDCRWWLIGVGIRRLSDLDLGTPLYTVQY